MIHTNSTNIVGTNDKFDLAVAKATADLYSKGFKVAIQLGEGAIYDFIAEKDNQLKRIKAQYVESNGEIIEIRCRSSNLYATTHLTSADFDWLAAYDAITDCCYYIPSAEFGAGRNTISLRLLPTRNNQNKGVRWARDYLNLIVDRWCRSYD